MANLAPTAADVIADAAGRSVKFGEAAVAADIVYLDKAAGHWLKLAAADDHGDTSYGMVVSGSVNANQHGSVVNIPGVVVAMGAILTAGKIYVASKTSGKIREASEAGGAVNEVQTVTVSGATTGTFTLTFDGQTTGAIAFDATAADVKTALEALSNIDAVSATGGPLNSAGVAVTFEGDNAATDVSLMTVTDSTDGTVSVAETTAGYAGDKLFIVGHAKTSSDFELLLKNTGDAVA